MGCGGTSRFDAASLRNGPKLASAHPAPARLRHDPTRFSRSSEIEASEVPVHQPPDHEDDQDQPEYAADPKGPTLTVIAAAIVPKSASKEDHEQQDDQNQFHRSVFHQCRRQSVPSGVGSRPLGPIEPAVEWRPSQESMVYRSGLKHRLTMRDSTMSIYTHRS